MASKKHVGPVNVVKAKVEDFLNDCANSLSPQGGESGAVPDCKTSIPGSNPGGASKILKKSALFVRAWHKHRLPDGLKLLIRRRTPTVQHVDSPRVVRARFREGGGLENLNSVTGHPLV
jgi:hypothetical protein